MYIDQFWLGVLIAVLLTTGMVFLLLQVQKMKHSQGQLLQEKQALENRLKSLESKIEFLNTGSVGIGQRLMNAEKRLNQALDRQEDITNQSSEHLFRRQADRVLKGRDMEPVEEESPSRSEAKLMALVSKQPAKKP
ncbi:hypothetical protein [Ketobacter sp.]|uniref:hypothetical protein n=1 Tax=Ketobacter sp. TaxID=2083498 RepID=UPI000F181F39|nr:hypothetical protein [Ketobacter sp.]RLU00498.1 MAG: hypothetical protein D9N14_06135 [Ketobacter sp.]